jgi:hypothetical protein
MKNYMLISSGLKELRIMLRSQIRLNPAVNIQEIKDPAHA